MHNRRRSKLVVVSRQSHKFSQIQNWLHQILDSYNTTSNHTWSLGNIILCIFKTFQILNCFTIWSRKLISFVSYIFSNTVVRSLTASKPHHTHSKQLLVKNNKNFQTSDIDINIRLLLLHKNYLMHKKSLFTIFYWKNVKKCKDY